jgi:ribosomal protein L7/L12
MEYPNRTTITLKVVVNTEFDEDLELFADNIQDFLDRNLRPEKNAIVTFAGADSTPRFDAAAANQTLENTFGTVGFELIREAAKTKKITAIRMVRSILGCGLTEAKDLVERWRFYVG